MGALRKTHSSRELRSLLWGMLSMLDNTELEQNFKIEKIGKEDIYIEVSELI